MARNQQSSTNSEGVCKKIRNAFSITPFKAKIHRISDHSCAYSHPTPQPQSSKHSRAENKPAVPNHTVRRDIVIANGEYNDQKKAARASKSTTKSSNEDIGTMKKKVEASKSNEKFSDYIRKVKNKMRTASNVGAAGTATRRDSFNDKVTNYINRAKVKIRTTSTSVGGDDKGASFK